MKLGGPIIYERFTLFVFLLAINLIFGFNTLGSGSPNYGNHNKTGCYETPKIVVRVKFGILGLLMLALVSDELPKLELATLVRTLIMLQVDSLK